ncbi:uncharacterized protein LOC110990863, partial [Acanthaster planci]|uniref:Uncharacterized protein LOC110990863 n=1 Tax=Acanthaster planci TaxID=133434 RepID=A0A8B8A6M2_ACAPL
MASMLHWKGIAVFVLLLTAFLLNGAAPLQLREKWANQSSTSDIQNHGPRKAIDGNLTTYTHTARRLAGAVISAGLSPNHNSNREIGAVTDEQATHETPSIDFRADPAVTARYVRVDLPGTNKILHMREVYVEEFTDEDGVGGAVDFTIVTNPALLGGAGNNDATIGAYKGPRDITAAVLFGRQLITGGANNELPSRSKELQSQQLGCQLRQIQLPEVDGLDRTGVFYCKATKPGKTATRIQTIILPTD